MLVCNWPHSVGQNHLFAKMLFNRDSTIHKCFRRPYKLGIIRPDDVVFHPDPPLYREASVPACIRPNDLAAHPDPLQYSIKLPILSKIIYGKITANRPDDVDSHPDALLLKTRIVIEIRPSGRLSALSGRAFNRYGNRRFDFNRLDACLSSSERVLI
jgi:hypothetical protein